MVIEFCVQNLDEILVADRYKAKRVELCAALEIGGITPSYGMVEAALKAACTVEVHPILRPNPGGFKYDDNAIEVMRRDILAFANLGVKGVVFGVLDNLCKIDISKNKLLIDLAKQRGLETTFHRAIDFTPNYTEALEELIGLGVDRILTSGQMPTAFEGLEHIKILYKKANGRIQIMAGTGINPENARFFTPDMADALHFTISKKKEIPEKFNMGTTYEVDTHKIEGVLNTLVLNK